MNVFYSMGQLMNQHFNRITSLLACACVMTSCGSEDTLTGGQPQVVINTTLTVPAGQFATVPFAIDRSVRVGHVQGSYQLTQGQDQGILFWIVPDQDLRNLGTDERPDVFWISGRRPSATFDLDLAAGTYLLFFDNREWVFPESNSISSAVIQIDAEVSW